MNTQASGIISLIKSALTNEPCVLPEGFDISDIQKIAKAHQIQVILYNGAINCGISKELPQMKEMLKTVYISIRRNYIQILKLNEIFNAFEKDGIDYMPLKGTILKKLYPSPEMRAMGDADILIRQEEYAEKIKPIMQNLGFEEVTDTDHEIVWNSPQLNVELHKRLHSVANKDFYAYFGDGWDLAKNRTGHYYHMNHEEAYIYLLTHLAKHYRNGGIGMRHFTDLWVYRQKYSEMNDEYIHSELQKIHLLEFYLNICQVLDVWFNGKDSNEMTDFITDFVIQSGSYGTYKNASIAGAIKEKNEKGHEIRTVKAHRIINAIFLPYGSMCGKYPSLKKAPVLLPVYWVYRWIQCVFGTKSNAKKVMKGVGYLSPENIQNYDDALKYVGLTLDIKE